MYSILMVLYVGICFGLIISVLLQSSKGEGLAGAFGGGGGGGGAVFGGRGAASFLSRATTVFAVLFMTMAVLMSFMGAGGTGGTTGPSAVQKAVNRQQPTLPATTPPATQSLSEGQSQLFSTPPADGDATTGDDAAAQPATDNPATDTGQ